MENNTPRNVIIQIGALGALYLSLSFLLTLLFGLINLMHPDDAESYWDIESAVDSVRLGVAVLIVAFPTYIFLTRLVNQYRRESATGSYQNITRWLVYTSLLVGGSVLLGTLVTTIYTFLDGELTSRFFLKAGAVVFVVGTAFHYYIMDARGYWVTEESKSIMFGIGASLAVLLALAGGITHVETPAEARELRLDESQIADLQIIQNTVETYYRINYVLPDTLDEAFEGGHVPTAPESRDEYSYQTNDKGFEMCATFFRTSINRDSTYTSYYDPELPIKNPNNWDYDNGRYCFNRVVNQ